eukprot:3411276-Alexandrium_andersonii.AAC.1
MSSREATWLTCYGARSHDGRADSCDHPRPGQCPGLRGKPREGHGVPASWRPHEPGGVEPPIA